MTVMSTSPYGTVINWDEANMFTSLSAQCASGLSVTRTSGYYNGYPFEPGVKIFEEYIAVDGCGNKSSCSFYVTTSKVLVALSGTANGATTTLATSLKPSTATTDKIKSGLNAPDNKDLLTPKKSGGAFALYQNIPNPMNYNTTISFNLPNDENVKLTVFNISGQVLMNKSMDAKSGYNEASILKSELNASGVLFYRLESGDNIATKKMVVLE